MGDKMIRIANLLRTGTQSVSDESVEDTLTDLAAYSILLSAYLKSEAAKRGQTWDEESKSFRLVDSAE